MLRRGEKRKKQYALVRKLIYNITGLISYYGLLID
jgi:hypothetical protein